MLNFEADFITELLEEHTGLELDVEKIEKFMGTKDIMDFHNSKEFFEEYFDLKKKSWGELYDFMMNIIDTDNYSYDDNVLDTILKNYTLGNSNLYECLHKCEYEDGYFMIFVTPGTIEACKKEKEAILVGRMSSDEPFVETAFYNYNNDIYGGLTLKEFKNAIDRGIIVVFDNRKNFIEWYLDDLNDYKEILNGLRQIESLNFKDIKYDTIDDYIINVVLAHKVVEFSNCIIMDCEM